MEKNITSYSSNKPKSHPDKFLEEHLLSVGNLCQEIISSKKLNLDRYIDYEILQDISFLIGLTHDCGKATSYFQNYINEKDGTRKAKLKSKPETHHGFISSIFAYYTIKGYLSDKDLLNKRYYRYLPVICLLVVKKHHGGLDNIDDEIINFEEKVLQNQINAIDFDKLNEIYKGFFQKIGFNFDYRIVKDKVLTSEPVYSYGKIKEYRKKYKEDLKTEGKLVRNIDEEKTLFYYFTTLFLYSVLLDADKTDAAELKRIKRIDIDESIIDEYKKVKFNDKDSKINRIRNEIYDEVISKVENISLEKNRILSLNVPTGTGKTLTSLSFALKLRKRIENEKGYSPRIIYSLPFLSIIDQNFAIFEDVFKSISGEKPDSNTLLKHHHLSDVVYKVKEEEFENIDRDIGKDFLLIEGWNSEIIVTTFMQFFYSLISNRNRVIRKFHNITNSIIILDEVQAIPHKYWLLLNKTIKFFAEHFNTYFIFITATQPLIFDKKASEIKPLVENKKKYFKLLDRVSLKINLECISIDDFKKVLKKDIVKNLNKDFLIVLNTINSSTNIYNYIKDLNLGDDALYYLSTNIIPKKRLERIKAIRKKITEWKIVVSTQLIEAGVDIDVDIVYRDFAPFDSINQVAGRCNRNFGDKKGTVKIFILKENNDGKVYYPYTIYGSFITDKTRKIFEDTGVKINEPNFLQLSNNYFEKINSGKSDDSSDEILKNVENLKFDELSNFKLIEEDYCKVDVFVEVDDEAKKVWQNYQRIFDGEFTPFERKNEFLKIKKQFYDYVISTNKKYAGNLVDEKYGIGYVAYNELESYYDLDTGFKRKNAGCGTLFA